MSDDDLIRAVQFQYAGVARGSLTNESAVVRAVAEAFGYSADDLASLPPQANMGLSCGNPIALAGLRPGEVVLDLGRGDGLDVVLAARRVGSSGKVIGVDMTPEMIDRARASAVHADLNHAIVKRDCRDEDVFELANDSNTSSKRATARWTPGTDLTRDAPSHPTPSQFATRHVADATLTDYCEPKFPSLPCSLICNLAIPIAPTVI